MPIHIVAQGLFVGLSSIPYIYTVLKLVPWLILIYALKRYFGGATNTSERVMHSKVVIITGGTSGIGAHIARALAARGAQIVLLTQHPLSDPFLADYIMDLRAQTNNELITAEHVNLSSLHSIRLFATRWVDNAPPRRLDMVILCANTLTPPGGKASLTEDGLESNWGVNYVANFHLLSILSPALRAQPPDRDVRIIFGTCSSYMAGSLPNFSPTASGQETQGSARTKAQATNKFKSQSRPKPEVVQFTPSSAYANSKLALMNFSSAFQKHLSSYSRPDKQPMNAHVVVVDPGWSRTPGMRRYLTYGSLWGLAFYLLTWPLWWLVLKSPEQGAQSFLWAAMEASLGRGVGGKFVKECREVRYMKDSITDEEVQRGLWEATEKTIEALEKEWAVRRAQNKRQKDQKDQITLVAPEELANEAYAREVTTVRHEVTGSTETASRRNRRQI